MHHDSHYAFISYSRKDSGTARWLQRSLEHFRYPRSLISEDRRPPDPDYLRPIFLDQSDLPTSDRSFWADLCVRIDASHYLIVICTRSSATSTYVNDEIARFIGDDESRVGQIIIVIADSSLRLDSPGSEDFPPEILKRWQRFSERNLPLLFPSRGNPSTLERQIALMQIASFMLGIDWTILHNRYLIGRRKALAALSGTAVGILATITCLLAWAFWKQRELTVFERKIFPYSIVVGYVDNFLSPLITALESRPVKPLIVVVLPNTFEELDHNKRVAFYRERAEQAGYSAEFVKIATSLPRGAETAVIVPTPPFYKERNMEVYIDFASTVAAFRHVIEYKKENQFYSKVSENSMLVSYADEFERSVMERLKPNASHGDQRERVVFVRTPEAALRVLNGDR